MKQKAKWTQGFILFPSLTVLNDFRIILSIHLRYYETKPPKTCCCSQLRQQSTHRAPKRPGGCRTNHNIALHELLPAVRTWSASFTAHTQLCHTRLTSAIITCDIVYTLVLAQIQPDYRCADPTIEQRYKNSTGNALVRHTLTGIMSFHSKNCSSIKNDLCQPS